MSHFSVNYIQSLTILNLSCQCCHKWMNDFRVFQSHYNSTVVSWFLHYSETLVPSISKDNESALSNFKKRNSDVSPTLLSLIEGTHKRRIGFMFLIQTVLKF